MAIDAPQFEGFKAFYQFASPTRVIAGRELIEGVGFEFAKEGAGRVMLVTDEVIRATGLTDRVEAGLADGGLELAAVFDAVPQDSDTGVVVAGFVSQLVGSTFFFRALAMPFFAVAGFVFGVRAVYQRVTWASCWCARCSMSVTSARPPTWPPRVGAAMPSRS